MNESLLAEAIRDYCTELLALKKSGDWQLEHPSFEDYCQRRWSLSKTRVKLLLAFAAFCAMCRDAALPLPTSPENVAPVLRLQKARWLDGWRLVVNYAGVGPINAAHCESTLQHFGLYARKRPPEHVVEAGKVRRSFRSLASVKDPEGLVEKIGPRGLGRDVDAGFHNAVEIFEAKMNHARNP